MRWWAIAIVFLGCHSRPPHDLIWPFDGDPTIGNPPPKKATYEGPYPGFDAKLDEAFAKHHVFEEGRKLIAKACVALQSAAEKCLDLHESELLFNISLARSTLYANDATPAPEREANAWQAFHVAVDAVRDACAPELTKDGHEFFVSALSGPLRRALNEPVQDPGYFVAPFTSAERKWIKARLEPLVIETDTACMEKTMEPRKGKWIAAFRAKI